MKVIIIGIVAISVAFVAYEAHAKGIVGENVIQSSVSFLETDTNPKQESTSLNVNVNQHVVQGMDLNYGIGYQWTEGLDTKVFTGSVGPRFYLPVSEMIKPFARAAVGIATLTDVYQYSDVFYDYYDTETYLAYGYGLGAEFNIERLYLSLEYRYSEIDNEINSETKQMHIEAGYWISEQISVFSSYSDAEANDVLDLRALSFGFAWGF